MAILAIDGCSQIRLGSFQSEQGAIVSPKRPAGARSDKGPQHPLRLWKTAELLYLRALRVLRGSPIFYRYRVRTGRRNGILFRVVPFSLSSRWALAKSLTLITANTPPLAFPLALNEQ